MFRRFILLVTIVALAVVMMAASAIPAGAQARAGGVSTAQKPITQVDVEGVVACLFSGGTAVADASGEFTSCEEVGLDLGFEPPQPPGPEEPGFPELPQQPGPTVTITTPPNGAVYALGQRVTADFSCQSSDPRVGLRSCDAFNDFAFLVNTVDTPGRQVPINTRTVGTHSFRVVTEDTQGLTAELTHTYQVVDITQPAQAAG